MRYKNGKVKFQNKKSYSILSNSHSILATSLFGSLSTLTQPFEVNFPPVCVLTFYHCEIALATNVSSSSLVLGDLNDPILLFVLLSNVSGLTNCEHATRHNYTKLDQLRLGN